MAADAVRDNIQLNRRKSHVDRVRLWGSRMAQAAVEVKDMRAVRNVCRFGVFTVFQFTVTVDVSCCVS